MMTVRKSPYWWDFFPPYSRLRDFLGRLTIVGLYVWLLVRMVASWQDSGHLTGLIATVGFSLAIAFTVTRRPARQIDGAPLVRLATLGATVAPLLFAATARDPLVPDTLTRWLALLASLWVWTGLLTLGRSFAFLPAHRGLAQRGLYRIVRHPLYAGYVWLHLAVVLAYPSWWNLACWIVAEGSQFIRLQAEERILATDPAYRQYQTVTRWRLVPGIY